MNYRGHIHEYNLLYACIPICIQYIHVQMYMYENVYSNLIYSEISFPFEVL